jgi:asparagine synthase (glutamine-hydrolysing)
MCGIAGLWTQREKDLEHVVLRMADQLRHRGPDDGGVWLDREAGLALGHRRLSILDLSPEGRQPMVSRTGRYVIVFNGEIYNFLDLRRDLELDAYRRAEFRGHSDTEVMLAAFDAWGPEAAVRRFVGMFAFALWDRTDRRLYLARDHLGIKPLYYGWADANTLVFGSELRALRGCPWLRPEIDRGSLALFLRHNCVPAPHSIYKGIRKLQPGCLLVTDSRSETSAQIKPFWSAKQAAEQGVAAPFAGSEAVAIERLDELLRNAVKSQMVADVPLGAFLSGGVDSSTVVALMQAQSTRPVRTFTIGFEDPTYNEATDAKRVAEHLGTDHMELYVSAGDAMAVIPKLPTMYDEPFADSSQIPTFLVSELARREVTVSLSGDGGDELFAGYNRHAWLKYVWGRVGWVPPFMRRAAARGIERISAEAWNRSYNRIDPWLPRRLRQRMPGYKLHRLAEMLGERSPEAAYRSLVSHWKEPSAVVLGATEPETALTNGWADCDVRDITEKMMCLDTLTYLPDDILTKVDRATMAVSLEARVPLLDHRVVEFAWKLPLSMKLRDGQSKWALRQVLYRYVPREIIERPKSGFGIPVDAWLRGPLRDWAEDLLDERRIRQEGLLDPKPIREKWAEHLEGRRSWQYHLWDVLMFQAWLVAHHGDAGAGNESARDSALSVSAA